MKRKCFDEQERSAIRDGRKRIWREPVECPDGWSFIDEAAIRLDRKNTLFTYNTPEGQVSEVRSSHYQPGDEVDFGDGQSGRILSVRVERVQSITDQDAQYKGFERPILYDPSEDLGIRVHPMTGYREDAFREHWESKHPGSWDRNDWVWVYEFEKASP